MLKLKLFNVDVSGNSITSPNSSIAYQFRLSIGTELFPIASVQNNAGDFDLIDSKFYINTKFVLQERLNNLSTPIFKTDILELNGLESVSIFFSLIQQMEEL